MLGFYTALSTQSNVWYSVKLGLVDPRRLFVKNELHSEEKAAQGRWRLIWAISAVDQVFEGLFTKEHNQAISTNYYKQTWKYTGLGVGHGHSDPFHENMCRRLAAWSDVTPNFPDNECPALSELKRSRVGFDVRSHDSDSLMPSSTPQSANGSRWQTWYATAKGTFGDMVNPGDIYAYYVVIASSIVQ
eukprot:1870794-Amphidinium_carterae.1